MAIPNTGLDNTQEVLEKYVGISRF